MLWLISNWLLNLIFRTKQSMTIRLISNLFHLYIHLVTNGMSFNGRCHRVSIWQNSCNAEWWSVSCWDCVPIMRHPRVQLRFLLIFVIGCFLVAVIFEKLKQIAEKLVVKWSEVRWRRKWVKRKKEPSPILFSISSINVTRR